MKKSLYASVVLTQSTTVNACAPTVEKQLHATAALVLTLPRAAVKGSKLKANILFED